MDKSPSVNSKLSLGSKRSQTSFKDVLDAGFLGMADREAAITFGGRMSNSVRSTNSNRGAGLGDVEIEFVFEKSPLMRRKAEEVYNIGPELSPPLIIWIGPALFCALAYALYNIFIKKGSASINPVLGGVILQFVAALFGTILLGVLIAKEGTDVIQFDGDGIKYSIYAGVFVGIAEMVSFVVSGMGVQATQSIPIIIGGSVMFGSVLGWLMLHEVMTMHGWFGVVLLVVGIGFVATDPGAKLSAH